MDEITIWPSEFAEQKAAMLQSMGWFISRDRLHAISPATGNMASLTEATEITTVSEDGNALTTIR